MMSNVFLDAVVNIFRRTRLSPQHMPDLDLYVFFFRFHESFFIIQQTPPCLTHSFTRFLLVWLEWCHRNEMLAHILTHSVSLIYYLPLRVAFDSHILVKRSHSLVFPQTPSSVSPVTLPTPDPPLPLPAGFLPPVSWRPLNPFHWLTYQTLPHNQCPTGDSRGLRHLPVPLVQRVTSEDYHVFRV